MPIVQTFAGQNGFALTEAVGQITGDFVANNGDFGLERIDAETATPDRIRESLTSLPFLTDAKMVVVRSLSFQKGLIESIDTLLASVGDSTDVVIVEPKLDKRSSYYKYLKQHTYFHEFNEPTPQELASWLVQTVQHRGASLSLSDARYLIERMGPTQLLLSQEIEKLLLFSQTINRDSIDMLTEATPQSTIFQLLEAAFAGRTDRALKLYAEQRQLGVEPANIIAMLSWQLHILVTIKAAGKRNSADIAHDSKLSPYVIDKSQVIARALSVTRLRELIDQLLDIDVRSKRQSIDLDDVLQLYLLTLRVTPVKRALR